MADAPLPIAAIAGGERPTGAILDLWKFDSSRFRINHIKTPDTALPYCHNHPWEFCWGMVLNGGYTHEFFDLGPDKQPGPMQTATFRSGGPVNFMLHSRYHRIVELEPDTYTLFFWGPDVPRKRLEYWVPGRGSVTWADMSK